MTVSPAPRPRSAFLGALDGILLGLGIVFLASLAAARWVRLDAALETWILRAALGGSLFLFAWGLFRWGQRSWAKQGWSPGRHTVSLALALTILAGWPILLTLDVRQAVRAGATTELCVLVRRVDRPGPLALAAWPARALALDALRQQAAREQDPQALEEVVRGVLHVGAADPDLTALKQDAASRLASLARSSADPFLLASFAGEARQHGWEDDPDCSQLLAIWHQRTDHGPF